jgi:hypothetical protein
MRDELFDKLDIVARYRAGPDVEARERFLRQASAEGHSRSPLKRIAWALLFVAEAVQSHGGSISYCGNHCLKKLESIPMFLAPFGFSIPMRTTREAKFGS